MSAGAASPKAGASWAQRLARGWAQRGDRILLLAAAVLLAACLAAPSWPIERSLFDHIVVLDITQSMNVVDARLADDPSGAAPASRLSVAKRALREALLRLPCGSRIGWSLFTEHRVLLLLEPIEVCANLGELRSTLDAIDNRMAWNGNSEVAKGLYAALKTALQVPGQHSLVFITDGHEAPPINPRHRPRFDGEPGQVSGLIVGVGGSLPSRIPKSDPSGRPLGYWEANEVMQVDPRSLGRGGSVAGEALADDGTAESMPLPGASPGSEHLSALREPYLELLASETGLGYLHLGGVTSLADAMTDHALARPVVARTSLSPLLSGLALLLLLARHRASVIALWTARHRLRRGRLAGRRGPRPAGSVTEASVQSAPVGMHKTGSL